MAKGLLGPEQDAALWSRVIQFDEGLTPTAARALLKIKFSQADQRRLSELAEKARRGTLSGDEEHLAGAYERLGCVLDILHSKARQALKRGGRKAS